MQSVAGVVLTEALPRVVLISVLIGVGVGLANVAVEFGLVTVVARVGRYLTEPANLPEAVGTAILTNTVSVTAGYGMLAEFRESGLLDDRATLVAIVINTFFSFLQHIFTYYAPVLIPILGLQAGLLYVGTRAGISLAITIVGLLAGAILLRGYQYDVAADATDDLREERTTRARLRSAGEKTLERLRSIVPRLAIIYTLVVLGLAYPHVFPSWLRVGTATITEPLAALVGLPAAAVPIVLIATVDPTSGVIAIAPMIGEVFTPTEAVITLLLGSLVSITVTTLKRSIPFQFGIWGVEFGTKVIVVNTGLRAVFIVVAIVVLLVV